MPKSHPAKPTPALRGPEENDRPLSCSLVTAPESKLDELRDTVLIFAHQATCGEWRAWMPDAPHLVGQGKSQDAAIEDIQGKFVRDVSLHASAQPDAPMTKAEAAALAEMEISAQDVRRAAPVDYHLTILRECIRGEPERTLFLQRFGSAGVFQKWTRFSPSLFESLAKNHGEAKIVAAAFKNMVDLLTKLARRGSPECIAALHSIGAEAARGLESARGAQPEKVKEFSRGALAWPLFYCPQTGMDIQTLGKVADSLEIGALSPMAKTAHRLSAAAKQTTQSNLHALCTCIHGGLERARLWAGLPCAAEMEVRAPWITKARALPPLPPGGEAGIAEQWFSVAWDALLWAFDGAPEKDKRMAQVVAQRKKHGTGRYGTARSILKTSLLRPVWRKRYGTGKAVTPVK